MRGGLKMSSARARIRTWLRDDNTKKLLRYDCNGSHSGKELCALSREALAVAHGGHALS